MTWESSRPVECVEFGSTVGPVACFHWKSSVPISGVSEAWEWLQEANRRALPPNKLPQYDAEALLDKLQAVYPDAEFTLGTPDYCLHRKPKGSQ